MHRFAPLVAVALLAAGCGSGSERLSKAEYVRKADAICTSNNKRLARLETPRTPNQIVAYTTKGLASLDEALAAERDLLPPKELDSLKQRWLRQADVLRRDVVALRTAAKNTDITAMNQALDKIARDDQKGNAIAAQLGLKVCSKP